jgi:hypothetical protein
VPWRNYPGISRPESPLNDRPTRILMPFLAFWGIDAAAEKRGPHPLPPGTNEDHLAEVDHDEE